ncbi:hypothetical protein [Ferrovum sp.]|uniref:hypothetical protein n=1 Tax=Ferrovum sp. TaxID=2609467 RepID=UPI00261F97DD|nr:hypothetical protein [Ferrovum sp.]
MSNPKQHQVGSCRQELVDDLRVRIASVAKDIDLIAEQYSENGRSIDRARDGIEATAKAIVLVVLGSMVVLLERIFEIIVLN